MKKNIGIGILLIVFGLGANYLLEFEGIDFLSGAMLGAGVALVFVSLFKKVF